MFQQPVHYDPKLLEIENQLLNSKKQDTSSQMASELGLEETEYNLEDVLTSPTANPSSTPAVDLNLYGMSSRSM